MKHHDLQRGKRISISVLSGGESGQDLTCQAPTTNLWVSLPTSARPLAVDQPFVTQIGHLLQTCVTGQLTSLGIGHFLVDGCLVHFGQARKLNKVAPMRRLW